MLMKTTCTFLRSLLPIALGCVLVQQSYAQFVLIIDSVNARAFPVVRAKIRVLEDNVTVSGLNVTNFTILEDGVVQAPIQAVCNDTLKSAPVSVMLVIDRSGSMRGTPLSDAQNAAKKFLDRLSASDEAGLVSFGGSVSYDQSWTMNKNTVKTAIDMLTANGGTPLWRAVQQASQLTRARLNKKVLIVLTDGENNDNSVSLQNAINQARSDSVIVFTIGLGNSVNITDLRQLATQTGGKYYSAPSSSDLDAIYQAIARQLTTTGICELWYTSKIDCLNGSVHDLEIVVNTEGRSARDKAQFVVPLDSTTFSFVDVTMKRDYVVEADSSITIPIMLSRVTQNRPPKVFQFAIDFDQSLLRYESADVTTLTMGYQTQVDRTASGVNVTMIGTNTISTTGELIRITFHALPRDSSTKAQITISRPDVQQFCTVTRSANGQITISGRCQRALDPTSKPQRKTQLLANIPNPFNPTTVLHYIIGREGKVTVKLYDAIGREVRTLVNGEVKAGEYTFLLNGSELATGKYFVRLSAPDRSDVRTIVIVK